MIWTMVMEKVQITFPWKSPSLSLSRLHACAAVGGVSVEVMEHRETAFSLCDTFSLNSVLI